MKTFDGKCFKYLGRMKHEANECLFGQQMRTLCPFEEAEFYEELYPMKFHQLEATKTMESLQLLEYGDVVVAVDKKTLKIDNTSSLLWEVDDERMQRCREEIMSNLRRRSLHREVYFCIFQLSVCPKNRGPLFGR